MEGAMRPKIAELIETTLIVLYLLGCLTSTVYIFKSIIDAYLRAIPYLTID